MSKFEAQSLCPEVLEGPGTGDCALELNSCFWHSFLVLNRERNLDKNGNISICVLRTRIGLERNPPE